MWHEEQGLKTETWSGSPQRDWLQIKKDKLCFQLPSNPASLCRLRCPGGRWGVVGSGSIQHDYEFVAKMQTSVIELRVLLPVCSLLFDFEPAFAILNVWQTERER